MAQYESWSLPELKSAVAAAQAQMQSISAMHASFAESSHRLAQLGNDLELARNTVASGWAGPAGDAATQSAANLQAYSRAAHEASFQSATATRELHRATRNHAGNMNQIREVDTSYHGALARSGGNPAAATVEHHQRVQESEQNRRAAVVEAQRLDAKGDEYHAMMKQTSWPKITSHSSTTVAPTRYPTVDDPTVPSTPPTTPPPTTTTPDPTRPVTQAPSSRGGRGDVIATSAGDATVSAGLEPGLGTSGPGSGGLDGMGGPGASGGGLTGSGDALGDDAGGLGGRVSAGRGAAAGEQARGSSGRGGTGEEIRPGGRGALAGEEGRGGMYGPGGAGGRRGGSEEEEKRRPDYLEEDDDPWGLGIAAAVPAVLGEEER